MAFFSILNPFVKIGWILLWAMVVLGCAAQDRGIQASGPDVSLFSWGSGIYGAPAPDAEEGEEEEEAPSTLGTLILYLPNRIIDLADLIRLGVNAGIGLGADVRATWLAQAVFISDTSVGVGFQGFRHLPICLRTGHAAMGLGPMRTPNLGLMDWPVNDYDVRVELFLLVVGAHVALDLEGVVDFILGFATVDVSDDDLVLGG